MKLSKALYDTTQKKSSLKFPIVMENYKCNAFKVIYFCEELKMYKLEYFPLWKKNYDLEGNISKWIIDKHAHVYNLEDYWINCDDEHKVRKKKYETFSLQFVWILKIHDILDQLEEEDGKVLNLTYNENRVYDELILDLNYESWKITSIKEFYELVLL